MITPQAVFDAAWQHFIVDRAPPAVKDMLGRAKCMYLTPDGNKCAVGLLIPDGHPAQHALDSVIHLAKRYPDLFPDRSYNTLLVLSDLQDYLHDSLVGGNDKDVAVLLRRQREAVP